MRIVEAGRRSVLFSLKRKVKLGLSTGSSAVNPRNEGTGGVASDRLIELIGLLGVGRACAVLQGQDRITSCNLQSCVLTLTNYVVTKYPRFGYTVYSQDHKSTQLQPA
jgi:hypothetical protein